MRLSGLRQISEREQPGSPKMKAFDATYQGSVADWRRQYRASERVAKLVRNPGLSNEIFLC